MSRKCLKLAVLRYVDDFFGGERPETLAHAVHCFSRLVKLLLGASAVAAHKIDFGATLVVLGIELRLSAVGFCCRPAVMKVQKWIECIKKALAAGVLEPGEASKLAGRLRWACQHMFRKIGRAMIRPLYDHCKSRSGAISKNLREALLWWLDVLLKDRSEMRRWFEPRSPTVHLFCDAAGDRSGSRQ